MKLLSIETSCDDTAISIFEAKGGVKNASFKVLANSSNSQVEIHIPYGGVYPMLAKREHIKNLPILLEDALYKSKLSNKEKPVDLITVTYGPGLPPSLWAGITFAKDLASKWKIPLMPANHMEGHILSVFGKHKGRFSIPLSTGKVKTPILSLLVSGGHTQLVLTRKWMDYEIIGETKDDAVGEAFDKVARMLGLPYPGGPQISKLAERQREKKEDYDFSFPRPMLHSKDFNFSFAGLKTAVLYFIQKIETEGKMNEATKANIALEFENAAIECLVRKTEKAIEKYKIRTLIVAGGVAANKHLKNEIKKITGRKIKTLFPTMELAGDNSLMIGIAGYLNYVKNKKKTPKMDDIKATGSLKL